MKRYALAIMLFLSTNAALCSTEMVDNDEEINGLVLSFIKELKSLKIKNDELYINKIDNSYKSSYWSMLSSEDKKNIDIDFANMQFIQLSLLQGGKIIHSKKRGNLACVFVFKKDLIGAFSLINEKQWKFMPPSLYFTGQSIQKSCDALGFELNIRDDDLIILKNSITK